MSKKIKKKQFDKIVKVDSTLEPEVMSYSKTLEPLRIVIKEVLKGSNAETVKAELFVKGFKCGIHKVYRLIRIGKKKIAQRAEKDFQVNYAWIEQNLFDLHAECIEEKDRRMRVIVLDKLMQLWGLNVQRVESIEMKVTPEKLAEYEQTLFGS